MNYVTENLTFTPITGYESMYGISSCGKVWSTHKKGVMKTYLNNRGYECIKLRGKAYTIHRLVALHYVTGYEENLTVDHIDNDKTNNHSHNLRWITREDNYQEMVKRGGVNTHTARQSLRLEKPVVQSTLLGEFVAEYPSLKEAGAVTGVSPSKISLVSSGRRKTAGGYRWHYKNPEDKDTFKSLPQ